ncbi:MAG: class I adenylate-forming enzyme family protein [Actinomycetes bacterium]
MVERADLDRPQPFDHLLRQVRGNPQDIAVASTIGDFTYRDLFDHSKRIASLLRDRGVCPGQVVATDVPAHLQLFFMAALFHEACIGCTYPGPGVPVERFDWLLTSLPNFGFPLERTIVVDDDFFAQSANESLAIDANEFESFDVVCRLLFSSGTTGTPHAIPFSVGRLEARSKRAEVTWMPAKPFMSIIGPQAVTGILTAYTSLASGFPYVAPGTAVETLELLRRNGIRSAKASPVQLAELINHLGVTGDQGSELLEIIESAGSVLPAPLAAEVRRLLAPDVRNLYGSSECGTVAIGVGVDRDPNDMGELLEHADVQVVDDEDRVLVVGEVGRLRWRTAEQADGYVGDAGASAASFRDGWFYPGDVGRITVERHIVLEGRESEFINVGGVKLSSVAIDEFLRTTSGIRDAAAFKLESPLGLPLIGIAVVISGQLEIDALNTAFARRFGGASITAVFEVDEIPRNAYGKPLRRELVERYLAALGAPAP